MIEKKDLLKTITELNNANVNNGKPVRYSYDENRDMVIMSAVGFDFFRKEMTPGQLYSGLRCSGWEYVPEEDKVLKNNK